MFDNFLPSLQSILEVASVLETFNESNTRALCPSLGSLMGLHVEELLERHIIEQVPDKEVPTYVFSNVLWKEMVYSMMPATRRENLHLLAAKWYEETFSQDLVPFYNKYFSSLFASLSRLAVHYSNAGMEAKPHLKSKAIFYMENAALKAVEVL